MKIVLYKTKSPTNLIGKELTDALEFDCKFKLQSSIISPTVEIGNVTSDISKFNYVYIPYFARYYFIRNIEIQPHNYYILTLDCDVLESWKDDILSGQAFVTKQGKYNKYYDSSYASEVKTESDIYESSGSIPYTTKELYLLTTIGG